MSHPYHLLRTVHPRSQKRNGYCPSKYAEICYPKYQSLMRNMIQAYFK